MYGGKKLVNVSTGVNNIRPPRTQTGERRYEDIVHIAGELFSERGFNGTSLKDIADAVGVLKGSLYHYINSKEDLLFDVIKVAHQGVLENMRLADHFASDPVRQIAAFCYGHVFLNAVEERIHRGIVFMQEWKHLAEDKKSQIAQDRDGYDAYLRAIVTRGTSSGAFDSEIDARLSSFAIFGVLTSYIRWYHPGGRFTAHDIGRETAGFVLASLVKSKRTITSRFKIVDEVIADLEKSDWLSEIVGNNRDLTT